MSNQSELDEPTNQHHVAFWQLQDLEEAIADAAPEELPELHSKLVALSTGLTQAILDWHNKQVGKARLNEVQNAYEHWINGRKFIPSYFRERIEELQKGEL